MFRIGRTAGWLSALPAVLAAAAAFGSSDDIDLTVTKTGLEGAVTLTWTGGSPAFEVLRGAGAPPATRVGDTAARAWNEAPSAAPLLFYSIRSIDLDVSLDVDNTGGEIILGTLYPSSSRLLASWSPAVSEITSAADHVEAVATEPVSGSTVRATATPDATEALLPALRSATSYDVSLRACLDATCSAFMESPQAPVNASTPQEVWQLQGTGSTVATLTRIVPDGNVKLHAFRYGADAPGPLAGKVQLYYGPMQMSAKGLAVGVAPAPATTDVATVSSFTSLAGSSGLVRPPSPATLVADVATGQAVPVSAAAGGLVRLYFEAPGADGKTRILRIDSRDGWTGTDFNAGAPTVCSTTADYSTGGGCAPTVEVGVAGDPVGGNPGIANARQFKIGFPTLDDWRWNLEPGTFMVFTTDAMTGCSTFSHNQVYARWSGSAWEVQRQPGGCPKFFASAQAATPLHLGGVRYKLYFGDPSDTTGRIPGSLLPFVGPKKVLYADGGATGPPDVVDFEDWETRAAARDTLFLWPSGEPLSAGAEGYIDDFVVVAPTASLDFQVLYVAITDGSVPPFSSLAVLVNP
jgi:hypothetical protein